MSFKNRLDQNVEAIVDSGNRVVTTEIDHDNIHLGKDFKSWVNFGSISAGSSVNILIKTPLTHSIHWRPDNPKPSVDKLRIKIFRSPTIAEDGEGTPLPRINQNDELRIESTVLLFTGPTLTDDGTQIDEDFLPGSVGVGNAKSGSELDQGNEKVLDNDTYYLLRYTNESSSACILNSKFNWYEILIPVEEI